MGCVKGAATSNLPEVKELVGGGSLQCAGERAYGQAKREEKGKVFQARSGEKLPRSYSRLCTCLPPCALPRCPRICKD